MSPQANRSRGKSPADEGRHSAHATGENKRAGNDGPDESYAEQQARLADEGRGGPAADDNGEE